MMKVRYWWPLIFVGLLLPLLGKALQGNHRNASLASVGQPLPAFTIEALERSRGPITQKTFLGHVSLLNVWATWCRYCLKEQPMLMAVARSKQVPLYGLVYKSDRHRAVAWLKKQGNPYVSNLYDPAGQLTQRLGVNGAPELLVIDKQGIVRYRSFGFLKKDTWEKVLIPLISHLKKAA